MVTNIICTAQAVSHRPLTAEAGVSPFGIRGGRSGCETGFSPSSSDFPCQYISIVALHILITPGGQQACWWPQF
jgi:hypothetical protein